MANRFPTWVRRVGLAASLSLLPAAPAFGTTPDCLAAPESTACKLDHALTLLYWAAGALGLLLVIVALLALSIYRRNKTAKLLPE